MSIPELSAPGSTQDILLDAASTSRSAEAGLSRLTISDYRRLNRRATQEGMYAGVLGGGAVTWAAKWAGAGKNILVLTFLLSATGISFITTRRILTTTLTDHYTAWRASREPSAPGGGGYLSDPAAVGDLDMASRAGQHCETGAEGVEGGNTVMRAMTELGKPRARTRWTKGRGLEGEVEEEIEMRDTWLRPGVPRREV